MGRRRKSEAAIDPVEQSNDFVDALRTLEHLPVIVRLKERVPKVIRPEPQQSYCSSSADWSAMPTRQSP